METNENNIRPCDTPEPHVTFKLESDRDCWEVSNPEINEPLVLITGYDIQCWFNHKYLKTLEDIEAASIAIGHLFRDEMLKQRIGEDKLNI